MVPVTSRPWLLASNRVQQVLPGIAKGFGSLRLQIGTELGHINSDPPNSAYLLAVRAAAWNGAAQLTVLAEREQGFLGDGVDCVRSGQRAYIRTSEALGSLVPVLAKSNRCARAPQFASRRASIRLSRSRYAA